MSCFTIKFIVAILTFSVGVFISTVFLIKPLPKHNVDKADYKSEMKPASKPTKQCKWDQILPQLENEYVEIGKKPPIEKLVALDRTIRELFNNQIEDCSCEFKTTITEDRYAKLGVHLNYWECLMYSEKLLADAHAINPRSSYRRYTLFSTIMGVRSPSGLGEMPNINAALKYEKEFPDGPFIKETLHIIADFNKDLYMVLRDNMRDYKYDCFKPHITKSPRLSQMNKARQTAIKYYEKLLLINPDTMWAKESLEGIKKGTITSWSFCAD